jgi:hypothetical protein
LASVRQPSPNKNTAISNAAAGPACHQPSVRFTARPVSATAARAAPAVLRIASPRSARLCNGPRYCIGAPLARIELQAVFSKLIPRFPGMRLAVPAGQLTPDTGSLTRGLARLPVTW